MINLIPNEEKKKMSRDFYFRLVAIFFTALGVSSLVASAALLPSYFLSSRGNNFINEKLQAQMEEPISLTERDALQITGDLRSKLDLVEKAAGEQRLFSQKVINEVLLKKPSKIRITEFSYQNNPQAVEKITVGGTAQSREALLSFRRSLERDAAFSKVDLPISNFIKESNIKFYLTLTL